jgi:hypothetical protein
MIYNYFFLKIKLKIKNIIRIKTIVAQLEVSKIYHKNSQITTDILEIILEIIKVYLKLGEIIFEIFAGIIKKAQISIIQNIFILIAIKIDKNIRKNKL